MSESIEWIVRGGVATFSLWLLYRARKEALVSASSVLVAAFWALVVCFACSPGPPDQPPVQIHYCDESK